MLTHEKASLEERIPYLAAKWYPMPILNVYGRCARAAPEIPTERSVWYGWRDHILPLILSPKHPDDTLFLVVEEDWRINKQDINVRIEDLLNVGRHGSASSAAAASSVPGVSSSPAALDEDDFTEGEARSERKKRREHADEEEASSSLPAELIAAEEGEIEFLYRVWKPKATHADFPQSLKDIVRICTLAHRENVGDLVWLAWEPAQSERKSHPSHGTTALAITKQAANVLQPWLAESDLFHFDVVLKRGLVENKWGAEMKASFVYKAIGSFESHKSSIEKKKDGTFTWVRLTSFDKSWIADGTRGERLQLCKFCKWGRNVHAEIPTSFFTSDDGIWKTLAPKGNWDPDRAAQCTRGASRYVPGLDELVSPSPESTADTLTDRRKRQLRQRKLLASRRHMTTNVWEATGVCL